MLRLSDVHVGQSALENVYSFEYLGARLQCDGADDADVIYRMAIAQATFGSLSDIWNDHPVARPDTVDLPTVGVLHPNSLVGGVDADRRSLSQHQRLQQPLSPPRHNRTGL